MNKKTILACADCGTRNYSYTAKAQQNETDRLELKKFCKTCGTHTVHRATK